MCESHYKHNRAIRQTGLYKVNLAQNKTYNSMRFVHQTKTISAIKATVKLKNEHIEDLD